MFEYLSEFNQVLVTGPQRSGTAICAKMIATDLGYRFMAESHMWDGGRDTEEWVTLRRVLGKYDNITVQCPMQCRWIHQFSADNVAIVMMLRNLEDIRASELRIGWNDWRQRRMYEGLVGGSDDRHIAVVKWLYWEQAQKSTILHPFEVAYEFLVEHPLWVPSEDRNNWGPKCIDVEDKFHDEIWV